MKSGAGEDPFAEETEDDKESLKAQQPAGNRDEGGNPPSAQSNGPLEEIPYIFRRDTVKEGRDQVPFFLRPEVANEGERQLVRQLEDAVGEDLPVTDAREAAYIAAQRHPELVVDVLEEWGYGLR